MSDRIRLVMPAILFCVLAGCSDNIKFSGKVTYEDGTPLTVGTVIFTTPTFQADGEIQPDGSYRLGSLSPKDGLPAGMYQVFVSGACKYEGIRQIPLVSNEFTSRKDTPLTCEVSRKGPGTFDFQVKKP